jgi:hypothetical protein
MEIMFINIYKCIMCVHACTMREQLNLVIHFHLSIKIPKVIVSERW